MRANPSRAAVAEEDYHFRQHRRLNWQIHDHLHVIELEIEAQIWLLDYAKRQGWTKQEQRRFRAARVFWENAYVAEVRRRTN